MPLAALLLPMVVAQGPKLVVPTATWEPIFFRSIDQRAKWSNLPSLRQNLLPRGDIEIRFWSGFGLTYLEGVVLRKDQKGWTAQWLPPTPPQRKDQAAPRNLPLSPKAFQTLWAQLQAEGILTLPDDSELPEDGVNVLDGMSYVVEYQREGVYRTYQYGNPSFHKSWPEAKRIMKIHSLLEETLRIGLLRTAHHKKVWGKG